MKRNITAGATNQTLYIWIMDSASTTGGGKTGIAYNAAGLSAYYTRDLAAPVAIALVTQTATGAYSSGGFVEVDATNTPGLYRLDVPNAALAAGVENVVLMLKGATGMAPVAAEVQLGGGTIGAVADKAGYSLSAGGVQAIWDALTSALSTAGSIGKMLVDRIVGTLGAGTHNAQSGDAYARIGAPAGASLAADVAAVPGAVWDIPTASHQIVGSTGKALTNAGAAGDPLSAAVPGVYAAGTAGYILGNLPDREINVVAPILTGQDLELVHGYDYLAADGRSEDVTVSTWPVLTGATCVLLFNSLTWAVVTVTAAQTIRIAVPRARWADITISQPSTIQYPYLVQATLASGNVVDLMSGTLRITRKP